MDFGIGLLIILYIVGSAIAAIMKKAMSGPLMEDPYPQEPVPDRPASSAEELVLAEARSDRTKHSLGQDQSQVLEGESRTPERWVGVDANSGSTRIKRQEMEIQEQQLAVLPRTIEDWQRALILAEILAPPVSKRR